MADTLFTYLLTERVKQVTRPNQTRDQQEEAYQEFLIEIEQAAPPTLSDKQRRALQNDIDQLKEELTERGYGEERFAERRYDEERFADKQMQDTQYSDYNLPEWASDIQRRIRRLEELLSRQPSIDDWQNRLEDIEKQLQSPTQSAYQPILQEYFTMSMKEFRKITPESHLWFLEQAAAEPTNVPDYELRRLKYLFLEIPYGVLRYLTISILSELGSRGINIISQIDTEIYDQNDNIELSSSELRRQIVDILLEISTDNAFEALQELLRRERYREQKAIIRSHIQFRLKNYDSETVERIRQMLGDEGNNILF